MLEHLTTEARNPASEDLDGLTAQQIVRLINAEDAKVAAAVAEQADAIAQAIDVIAERLARGGRLIYIGAGTSGRLGVLDAVECPPTFNTHPTQVVGLIAGGYSALTTCGRRCRGSPRVGDRRFEECWFDRRATWSWASRRAAARRTCWAASNTRRASARTRSV